jgi:hypothetical protein
VLDELQVLGVAGKPLEQVGVIAIRAHETCSINA